MTESRSGPRTEITKLGGERQSELAGLRTEIVLLRSQIARDFATKDDLAMLNHRLYQSAARFVRTFIVVQAATVVGMSGILFGLLRFA